MFAYVRWNVIFIIYLYIMINELNKDDIRLILEICWVELLTWWILKGALLEKLKLLLKSKES